MKKTAGLIIILIFTLQHVNAQKCEKVLFTGKVTDTLRPQSFYNLMVINRRTGQGVFGQPNGSFSVYVNDGDSISLSVKEYPTINLTVRADSNCQFIRKLIIEGKPKEIKTIEVRPLKSLEEIKEEREALAMRETRMVTGIEVMQSPITALYQAFSKKEQNKRWIAEQTYKDDQRKVVKELIRLYVAYDIINLNEDEFDQFISFLNINETFLKTATEMELITFISDKYDHFKVLNKINSEENPQWRVLLNTNKGQAIRELLNMYVSNKAIDLPTTEFDRFTHYMNLDENFLRNATDLEVLDHVRRKYEDYKAFYKINVHPASEYTPISNEDNQDWKWDLEHNKDVKVATITLLNLYNEHKVIQLSSDEYDKFIMFMNLKKTFMQTASNDQLIQFVREKYQKYLEFYKD
jgi:hypothetical protein